MTLFETIVVYLIGMAVLGGAIIYPASLVYRRQARQYRTHVPWIWLAFASLCVLTVPVVDRRAFELVMVIAAIVHGGLALIFGSKLTNLSEWEHRWWSPRSQPWSVEGTRLKLFGLLSDNTLDPVFTRAYLLEQVTNLVTSEAPVLVVEPHVVFDLWHNGELTETHLLDAVQMRINSQLALQFTDFFPEKKAALVVCSQPQYPIGYLIFVKAGGGSDIVPLRVPEPYIPSS